MHQSWIAIFIAKDRRRLEFQSRKDGYRCHDYSMLVIQRVRLRWSPLGRGASGGAVRGRVPETFPVPAGDQGKVVIHEILMDEETAYKPVEQIRAYDDIDQVDWLSVKKLPDGAIRIEWNPVWASYPINRRLVEMCTLRPGQLGRYRANFRFTGCACAPRWSYQQWTVNIAHAPAREDLFVQGRFHVEKDDRVSLYGKKARSRQ
jgi:hypothetical protein